MIHAKLFRASVLATFAAAVPALGQNATLRLVATNGIIVPGQQTTIHAFVDNLPVELHGYQIGLAITGGSSGEITAAAIENAVFVDEVRGDWVFADLAAVNENILTAGDPFGVRLFALIFDSAIGTAPQSERYAGTFVLEASADALGDFEVTISPTDIEDTAARTILMTVGGTTFPADINDPLIIPVVGNTAVITVQGEPVPATSTWGLCVLAILVITAGTIIMRKIGRVAA